MTVKRALGICVILLACSSLIKPDFAPHKPRMKTWTEDCVFPFSYKDVTYYTCTFKHSDYSWCSYHKEFKGHWRYCTADDIPYCVFPFLYGKTLFYSCTKVNYVLDRSWCSLTRNFNGDRKWKQCSPFNT